MKEFVLHQAGELTELRDVSPQKIHAVHHSQNPPDFPFAGHDSLENFLGAAGISIVAGDEPEISGKKIGEVGAKIEVTFLRDLEHLHHGGWILFKNVDSLDEKLALVNAKKTEPFRSCFQAGQKAKERPRRPGGASARE